MVLEWGTPAGRKTLQIMIYYSVPLAVWINNIISIPVLSLLYLAISRINVIVLSSEKEPVCGAE